MRKTLSLRPAAERAPAPARTGWNVSDARRKRLKDMAQTARRHPTDAQKALWARLGGQRAGGFKFHRQVVIGSTIVAFACPARWLVVEIAGKANAEVEDILDRRLSEVGVRVMRFTEGEIMDDLDTVVDTIVAELNQPFSRRDAVAANAAAAARSANGSPAAPAYAAASEGESYDDADDFADGFDLEADDDEADVDDTVFDAAFETADVAESAEDTAAEEADDAQPSAIEALFDSRDDFADADAVAESAAQ